MFEYIGMFTVWAAVWALGSLFFMAINQDEFGGLGALLGWSILYLFTTVLTIIYMLMTRGA